MKRHTVPSHEIFHTESLWTFIWEPNMFLLALCWDLKWNSLFSLKSTSHCKWVLLHTAYTLMELCLALHRANFGEGSRAWSVSVEGLLPHWGGPWVHRPSRSENKSHRQEGAGCYWYRQRSRIRAQGYTGSGKEGQWGVPLMPASKHLLSHLPKLWFFFIYKTGIMTASSSLAHHDGYLPGQAKQGEQLRGTYC